MTPEKPQPVPQPSSPEQRKQKMQADLLMLKEKMAAGQDQKKELQAFRTELTEMRKNKALPEEDVKALEAGVAALEASVQPLDASDHSLTDQVSKLFERAKDLLRKLGSGVLKAFLQPKFRQEHPWLASVFESLIKDPSAQANHLQKILKQKGVMLDAALPVERMRDLLNAAASKIQESLQKRNDAGAASYDLVTLSAALAEKMTNGMTVTEDWLNQQIQPMVDAQAKLTADSLQKQATPAPAPAPNKPA